MTKSELMARIETLASSLESLAGDAELDIIVVLADIVDALQAHGYNREGRAYHNVEIKRYRERAVAAI